MKLKYKLILDMLIAIAFILSMNYKFTGGFTHEVVGTALIAGFIIHIFINRKYYKAMLNGITKGKVKGLKHKASFFINVILLISTGFMLISSIAISQDLLPSISERIGAYGFWRTVHIISAITMSLSILLHVVMHFSMFERLIVKNTVSDTARKTWRILSGALAVIFTVVALKADLGYIRTDDVIPDYPMPLEGNADVGTDMMNESADEGSSDEDVISLQNDGSSSDNASTTDDNSVSNAESASDGAYASEVNAASGITSEPDNKSATGNSSADIQSASDTMSGNSITNVQNVPSLSDYLGGLFCDACGKHCSLLAPKCSRGEKQAEAATATYDSMYNTGA